MRCLATPSLSPRPAARGSEPEVAEAEAEAEAVAEAVVVEEEAEVVAEVVAEAEVAEAEVEAAVAEVGRRWRRRRWPAGGRDAQRPTVDVALIGCRVVDHEQLPGAVGDSPSKTDRSTLPEGTGAGAGKTSVVGS